MGLTSPDDPEYIFRTLNVAMQSCLDDSLDENRRQFGELHQIDIELGLWSEIVPAEHQEQLGVARRELATAEFCAASGLYRQAFSSLRLFLELSFASVYFSAHELERRRWEADLADFSWSKGLDHDSGVLSNEFVRAFQPLLANHSGQYSKNASETYRYCSQFIHGKASHSRQLPDTVQLDKVILAKWLDHAKAAGESVLFLLLMRYGELHMENDGLTSSIEERFAALNGVRQMIGLAGG